MTVSGAAIQVEDLHKRYGAKVVLEGLDLEVQRGEVFALLGPNGAGKTTTVEILEGYRRATSGTVRVLGRDPSSQPRWLRERTGVVLQSCGFPGHLRVAEVVEAWRGYYRHPRATDELLELVELGADRRTLVRRLSGGQRRRLDFALALAGDPELVYLDEPTTGFDPEARRRCWSVIENLRALGKTILLTTHYLDEAERLADRVAILNGGRATAVGTPAELTALASAPTQISFVDGHGERVVIDAQDPADQLRALLDEFGDLRELAVRPPRFEEVYLELVDRHEEAMA
jgi:ABC-2 type transport system ATP-binding protein